MIPANNTSGSDNDVAIRDAPPTPEAFDDTIEDAVIFDTSLGFTSLGLSDPPEFPLAPTPPFTTV